MLARRVLFALAACASSAPALADDQSAAQTILPRTTDAPMLAFGTGFDTAAGALRGRCVTGDVAYAGDPTSTLQFDTSLDQATLTGLISASAGAGFDLGLLGGSVATTITTSFQNDDTTRSLVFANTIQGKSALLANPRLTPYGAQVAASGDPSYIQLACGDEFVQEVDLGGSLFITLRFDFTDSAARLEVEEKVAFSVLGFKHVETMSQVSNYAAERTVMTVQALQVGGYPERLATLLATYAGSDRCTLKEMAPCDAFLDALLAYATTDAGFPGQLGNLQVGVDGGDYPAVARHITRRYAPQGLPQLAPQPEPVVDAAVAQALADLFRLYDAQGADAARANAILTSFDPRPDVRARVSAVLTTITNNRLAMQATAWICARNPGSCLDEIAALHATKLAPYDQQVLAQPETFFGFCASAADEGVPAELQQTVDALLDKAATRDCTQAESWLSTQTSLSLRGAGLADLRPLRYLPALTQLDAAHNQVSALDPLLTIPQLSTLNLAYNAIADASPLAQLGPLENLRLQGNPPAFLTALAPLTARHLNELVATPEDACQIERAYALAAGLVSAADLALYQDVDFAPRYAVAGDRTSGIDGWYACALAATDL